MSVNVPPTSMPMRNRAWLMNPPQTGGTIRGLAASRKPQGTTLPSCAFILALGVPLGAPSRPAVSGALRDFLDIHVQ